MQDYVRMPSRHWYEIDEVEAMLSHCVLERKLKEAIFWLLELVESGNSAGAWRELVRIWILHYNFMFDGWIIAAIRVAEKGWTRGDLIDLCVALCGCPLRDCSVIGVCLLQGRQVDRVNGIGKIQDLETFVQECMGQGRARSAWWGCMKMTELGRDCWSLLKLKKLQKWEKIINDSWTELGLCGAVVWECGGNVKGKWEKWCVYDKKEIEKWTAELDDLLGRKARRKFEVCEEILYGWRKNGRGCMSREKNNRECVS